MTRQGDSWLWDNWGRGFTTEPTPLQGTPLDTHRVVSVSHTLDRFFALTADGTVFSWVVAEAYAFDNVERHRHVLGHGDAVDVPATRLAVPRGI